MKLFDRLRNYVSTLFLPDPMRIKIVRSTFTDYSTIGELYVNDVFECYTLEDVVRGVKIPKETAIPYGTYRIALTYSAKYGRIMPEVVKVQGFTGIRIHSGNNPEHTEGCILVGLEKGENVITGSRIAFNELFRKLQVADATGEKIILEVVKG